MAPVGTSTIVTRYGRPRGRGLLEGT
jgi:hypothetical protein